MIIWEPSHCPCLRSDKAKCNRLMMNSSSWHFVHDSRPWHTDWDVQSALGLPEVTSNPLRKDSPRQETHLTPHSQAYLCTCACKHTHTHSCTHLHMLTHSGTDPCKQVYTAIAYNVCEDKNKRWYPWNKGRDYRVQNLNNVIKFYFGPE